MTYPENPFIELVRGSSLEFLRNRLMSARRFQIDTAHALARERLLEQAIMGELVRRDAL